MLPFSPRLVIGLLAVVTFCLGSVSLPPVVGQAQPPAAGQPKPLAVLTGHEDTIYTIAFHPSGQTVVTGSFDKTVRIWDAATGKQLRVYGGQTGHQNLVLSVDLSPDGQAIVSSGSDNTARVWDMPMLTPARQLALPLPLTALAASPDKKQLAVGLKAGGVKVLAGEEDKELFALSLPGGAAVSPAALAYSPNSQSLLIADSGGQLTLALASGKVAGHFGSNGQASTSAIVNPNGKAAYVGGADGLVRFWKLSLIHISEPTRH